MGELPNTEATDRFWREFNDACGIQVDQYDVVAFGDDSALATELADLVVAGRKRATAGLLREFENEPPPVLGGYVVLVDGEDLPPPSGARPASALDRCIPWRTGSPGMKARVTARGNGG